MFAILKNGYFGSPGPKPLRFQRTPECLKSNKDAQCKMQVGCQPMTEQSDSAAKISAASLPRYYRPENTDK